MLCTERQTSPHPGHNGSENNTCRNATFLHAASKLIVILPKEKLLCQKVIACRVKARWRFRISSFHSFQIIYGQTVLPDSRALLVRQKLMSTVKIEKFKCDILSNFQIFYQMVRNHFWWLRFENTQKKLKRNTRMFMVGL